MNFCELCLQWRNFGVLVFFFCEIWLWPKLKGAYEEETISCFFLCDLKLTRRREEKPMEKSQVGNY
jgi:hypothetical protein